MSFEDNDLGKMVEYKTMTLMEFEGTTIPAGFANSFTSGKSTWDANPNKQDKATKKANELIKKFEDDEAERAKNGCGC